MLAIASTEHYPVKLKLYDINVHSNVSIRRNRHFLFEDFTRD